MGGALAEGDLIDAFFDELGRRGYDPLLGRLSTTGRFEICDGDRVERWVLTVHRGHPAMTPDAKDIGWVVRVERGVFTQLVTGEVSALESLMRGALSFTLIDESQRFSLLTRLFAGAPATRTRSGPLVDVADDRASPEPA